jgi:hypothetical protein
MRMVGMLPLLFFARAIEPNTALCAAASNATYPPARQARTEASAMPEICPTWEDSTAKRDHTHAGVKCREHEFSGSAGSLHTEQSRLVGTDQSAVGRYGGLVTVYLR